MPNWCENIATFKHNDLEMMAKLNEAIDSKDLFKSFFPTPFELDDDAQHPRKWVADAINENLEAGEDIFDIEIEEFSTVEEALPLDNDE